MAGQTGQDRTGSAETGEQVQETEDYESRQRPAPTERCLTAQRSLQAWLEAPQVDLQAVGLDQPKHDERDADGDTESPTGRAGEGDVVEEGPGADGEKCADDREEADRADGERCGVGERPSERTRRCAAGRKRPREHRHEKREGAGREERCCACRHGQHKQPGSGACRQFEPRIDHVAGISRQADADGNDRPYRVPELLAVAGRLGHQENGTGSRYGKVKVGDRVVSGMSQSLGSGNDHDGTTGRAAVEVVEYTDPACSWAWGSEPKLRLLQWSYGDRLAWRRVMGGLVPDRRAADPGFDPVGAAPRAADYWAKVSEETHMPHPAQLRYAPTSSIVACIAVKAAERQGEHLAARLLRRLREACFVFCEPADTIERVSAVARGVDGLDIDRLTRDVDRPEVRADYQANWEETRHPNDYVRTLSEDQPGAGMAKRQEGRWRYVFPTLILRGPQGESTVPGWKPYGRYLEAMESVAPGSTAEPRPRPTAAAAFERWPLLAEAELTILCCDNGAPLPAGTIPFDGGGGVVWMTPAEASSSPVLGLRESAATSVSTER